MNKLINRDLLEHISSYFISDDKDSPYPYLSGPNIINFFNENFNFNDHYYSGFPTRRVYCADCLQKLIDADLFENFLDIVIDDDYFLKDFNVSKVEASDNTEEALVYMSELFFRCGIQLDTLNGHISLIEIDKDVGSIGSGGFADVFLRKSTGLVEKRLKRKFWSNEGIVSRFRREFEILKDLQDVTGVVEVYDFNSDANYYSMEYAGETLECYLNHELNSGAKKNIIIQILSIIAEIHSRNIAHRDLSPNNIFVKDHNIIVTDFGLGKDFDIEYSHRTVNTNNYGSIGYAAPEQISDLKMANIQSDVFSLGRIINLIMTGNCMNLDHEYSFECDRATCINPEGRYTDANEMLIAIRAQDNAKHNEIYKKRIKEKLLNNILDFEVEKYYLNLDNYDACSALINSPLFYSATKYYVMQSSRISEKIISSIWSEWRKTAIRYEDCDPLVEVCVNIVNGKGNANVKIECCEFISFIAYEVRRYHAEQLVNDLLKQDLNNELKMALTSCKSV